MTEAANILKKVNANLLGMVLNRAPRKGLGNSYYGFRLRKRLRWLCNLLRLRQGRRQESSKKSSAKK